MCGIAGVFSYAGNPQIDMPLIRRMTDALAHRGPDDSGFYQNERVGLGHRRLSIIDIAFGHQPMSSRDGTVWITYNGEIFNHDELRDDLRRRGCSFATRSDTEVIVAAYQAFGERCVDHLNGQFAFAIFDVREQKLFLGRDRLGEKPLHYAAADGMFYFASEAKAFFSVPALSTSISSEAVAQALLVNALMEGRTMFEGIRELEQGFTLTVTREGPQRPRRYWDVPAGPPEADVDEAGAITEFDGLMRAAVERRLMSEVPLASFLSGGIDSSLISFWASRRLGPSLKTYTVQFERQLDKDDTRYAGTLASALDIPNELIPVSEGEYYDAIAQVAWHLERPFEVSAPTLYLLYRAARARETTVILTGEGADELMAGYYHTPGLGLERAFATLDEERAPWVAFRDEVEGLLSPEFKRQTGTSELIREGLRSYLQEREGATPAGKALYLFQKLFLCELLRSHDRLGMASSIESRAPFLDHHLVEWLARLPLGLKVRAGTEKYLLRKSLSALLGPAGDEIAWRAKKPLPAPRGESLRRQLADVERIVLSSDSLTRHYFDERKLRHFLSRREEFSALAPLVLYRVSFTLLALESFCRVFAGRGRAVPQV